MQALVIGGDGNLGRVLCRELAARGLMFVRTTRRKTDLFHPSIVYCDLRDLRDFDPGAGMWVNGAITFRVIYIMAAITGIMRAETDPDAWHVNAEAPLLIAQRARLGGHHVVFISSGTVERAQHTALARQKAYADQAVLILGGCVVRPLPFVEPDKYVELARLLIQVGLERRSGLVRWEG